ncbi:MAG: ammonium transporter [Leptospiraceae bacterium]|nr:ammonium transporter [Leptospiraceae bacterium]
MIEQETINALWILICSGLVMTMQAGFLCIEAGLTRAKNSINVAIKNVTDFGITVLIFWAIGFGLMFGKTSFGLWGTDKFFMDFSQVSLFDASYFIFQMMFCTTASTIVSGVVAERVRFKAYIFNTFIISLLIYPITGHWAWGNHSPEYTGWLKASGFVDFAGSTVVHSVGGWVALALLIIIGPRRGRYPENGAPRSVVGSNLPLSMLGGILLWVGWLGFNGGSGLAFNHRVAEILTNTIVASGGGLCAAIVVGYLIHDFIPPTAPLNGSLGGLVAITASCHAVSTGNAILIGSIGGVIGVTGVYFLDRLKMDDAVGGIPVHLFAGIWGTIAVALFADLGDLGIGLSRIDQLLVQLQGIAAIAGYAFLLPLALFFLINRFLPLRISLKSEEMGLNWSEHRATTELIDLFNAMDHQKKTGDISSNVSVEPFTEVGQIAERYNYVLERIRTTLNENEMAKRVIEEKKLEAEKANHAKSVFLANMTHELRTPMNAILGFTQVLKRDTDMQPDQRAKLNIIHESGTHLLALINDVLDTAKIEAGKIEIINRNFNFRKMLESVYSLFLPLASEKNLDYQLNIEHNTQEWVSGDEKKIRQMILNLVSNAFKFTVKGSVKISVSTSTIQSLVVARITVTDTGPGIPKPDHSSIFETFSQSESGRHSGEGTGLGLSITQKFANLMGGEVTLESEPGKGSSFTIEIKLHTGIIPEEEFSTHTVMKIAPGQKEAHHLIVDDNQTNRMVLRNILEDMGIRVSEVASGLECLAQIDKINPDLIWLDLRMADFDGLQTARALRKREEDGSLKKPALKIVALTASVLTEDKTKAIEAGCDEFIMKPFLESQLIEAIENLTSLKFSSISVKKSNSKTEEKNTDLLNHAREILLVEDEEANQQLFAHYMKRLGHKLTIAGSGEEAVLLFTRKILEEQTTFDFIFMDIELPGMNGFETSEQIRELEKKHSLGQTLLFAITAHDPEELDKAELVRYQISRIVPKPFQKEDLEAAITA